MLERLAAFAEEPDSGLFMAMPDLHEHLTKVVYGIERI